LKLLGVESVLVRVPDEPHGIAVRPSHHMSKIHHIISWFERHRKHVAAKSDAKPGAHSKTEE
jgi:dipeptidyl aminopeptidase/acylaminoacyl peptidase